MGDIITFYSYKGGVGRTMALANAAVLLAKWGYKVLIVDWDLEAPGLEFYFQEYFSLERAAQQQGIIDILENISKNSDDFVESARWQEDIITFKLPQSREPVHLLTSGQKRADYFSKVRNLDLNSLYMEKKGGFLIESLRNEWKEAFDFTLIDSRTGVTDIGGVCTIQLPDVLVLLFTANEQSLQGIIDIAKKALQARQKLPVTRFHLLSVPIPAKFDSREEYQAAQWWLNHFSERLRDLYVDWLPTDVNRRQFLEVTKLPYISYFSFGEKLPVIEQETNDPTGLGYAYENLAAMIANNWEPMGELLANRSYFILSARERKVRESTMPTLAGSLDETPVVQTLSKDEIIFPNNNRAQVVKVPIGTNPTNILRALDIQSPQVVITIAGDADLLNGRERSYLIQSFSNGLAQAASEIGAVIIDGGTASGVMEMIGQAVAKQRRRAPLLGIAPSGKVTYPGRSDKPSAEDSMPLDSNHTHFVLVESDTWGSETDTMHQVEEALGEKIPVVTVLISGGTIAKEEVLHSVQNNWPILVVERSGRLADVLASLLQKKGSTRSQRERANRTLSASQSDHTLTEIIDAGNIHLLPLETSVDQVRKQLKQLLLYQQERVLALAWERFALYDNNALLQQVRFRRLQLSSLVSGIAVTAVALVSTYLRLIGWIRVGTLVDQVIHFGIIVTAMALVIMESFLLRGNSWIFLRGRAEAIIQEIYRYRTQTGDYANKAPPQFSSHTNPKRLPQEILVEKIERISTQLMQTEINMSSLRPYTGPIPPMMYGAGSTDDGYSTLNPEQYISIRVEDQLAYYQAKAHQVGRNLVNYRWLILVLAGLGVLLASVNLELWIALIVVIITSLTAYLESRQSASKLLTYNKKVLNLINIKQWWEVLTEDGRASEENFVRLVNFTEETLMQADADKIQQFQEPVGKLREFSQKRNSPDEHIVSYK